MRSTQLQSFKVDLLALSVSTCGCVSIRASRVRCSMGIEKCFSLSRSCSSYWWSKACLTPDPTFHGQTSCWLGLLPGLTKGGEVMENRGNSTVGRRRGPGLNSNSPAFKTVAKLVSKSVGLNLPSEGKRQEGLLKCRCAMRSKVELIWCHSASIRRTRGMDFSSFHQKSATRFA